MDKYEWKVGDEYEDKYFRGRIVRLTKTQVVLEGDRHYLRNSGKLIGTREFVYLEPAKPLPWEEIKAVRAAMKDLADAFAALGEKCPGVTIRADGVRFGKLHVAWKGVVLGCGVME